MTAPAKTAAPLNARSARKLTGDALWTICNALSDKYPDMRTPQEQRDLKVVKAELDRRATASMSKYFVGIF